MQDMEHYLDWVAEVIGLQLTARLKEAKPIIIELGITTPEKFRDKFNKGSLDFPELERVIKVLKKIEKKGKKKK